MSRQRTSFVIAAIIAMSVTTWLITGDIQIFGEQSQQGQSEVSRASQDESRQSSEGQEQQADPSVTAPKPIRVETQNLTAQDVQNTITLTGISQPSQQVTLRVEIDGRIVDLPADEGAVMKKGDTLARIAIDDRESMVKEAKETVEQRRLEYEAAKGLEGQGFSSEVRVAQARSALEGARASLQRAEVNLDNTRVRAPFDGVLDTRDVDLGDVVRRGDQIGHFINLHPIEFEAFVSEHHIMGITDGQEARVTFINGQEVPATVTFISRSANLQSRTFRIKLAAPNPDHRLVGGMTATITLPLSKQKAHFLSPAFLTLDDEGKVGVKVVESGRAVFKPVEILKSSVDGVYVSGLPTSVELITVGHEFAGNDAPVVTE